jgi:hypothetical protein
MRRVSIKWGKCKLHLPGELTLILLLLAFLILQLLK